MDFFRRYVHALLGRGVGKSLCKRSAQPLARSFLVAPNDAADWPAVRLLRLRLLRLLRLDGPSYAALVARNYSLQGAGRVWAVYVPLLCFCSAGCQAEEYAAGKQWENYFRFRYLAGDYFLHFSPPCKCSDHVALWSLLLWKPLTKFCDWLHSCARLTHKCDGGHRNNR